MHQFNVCCMHTFNVYLILMPWRSLIGTYSLYRATVYPFYRRYYTNLPVSLMSRNKHYWCTNLHKQIDQTFTHPSPYQLEFSKYFNLARVPSQFPFVYFPSLFRLFTSSLRQLSKICILPFLLTGTISASSLSCTINNSSKINNLLMQALFSHNERIFF